jgi:hypothetical protein
MRSITVEQLGVGRYSVPVADSASVMSLRAAIRERTGIPGELQQLVDPDGRKLVEGVELPSVVALSIPLRGGCEIGCGTPIGGCDVCCALM